jgi:cell division protein FtsB
VNPAYSYAWHHFHHWFKTSVGYLWMVVLAGYLVVSAAQSVYKTYQAQQQTQSLQNTVNQEKLEKARLEAVLVYYQTDAYKEKELRRSLLLKMPGETVYALPESSDTYSLLDTLNGIPTTAKSQTTTSSPRPSWELWYEYLFK